MPDSTRVTDRIVGCAGANYMVVTMAADGLRGGDPGVRGPLRPPAAPDPARTGRAVGGRPGAHRRRLPPRAREDGRPGPRGGDRVPADRGHAGRAEDPP